MKNFSISGLPRCGSHFLAEMFNKSKTWTVNHELPEDFGKKRTSLTINEWAIKVNKRYQKDFYGEVTPQHLPIWNYIDVNKKVCIYRHPYDFWLSTINRRNLYKDKKFNWMYKTHYMKFYKIVDDIIKNNPEVMVVKFEDMIKDKNLVMDIANFVGIDDLKLDDINMSKKVNNFKEHKQKHTFTNLECLKKEQFNKIKENNWFCKKYYNNTIEERHKQKLNEK
jgi:hypothetical protein